MTRPGVPLGQRSCLAPHMAAAGRALWEIPHGHLRIVPTGHVSCLAPQRSCLAPHVAAAGRALWEIPHGHLPIVPAGHVSCLAPGMSGGAA
jgi:hypothetical protein